MKNGNYRFTFALDGNYTNVLNQGYQAETEGLVVAEIEISSKDQNSKHHNITQTK